MGMIGIIGGIVILIIGLQFVFPDHAHAQVPARLRPPQAGAAVIGVIKSPLRIADRFVPVPRGRSRMPLYVSAVGCSLKRAARSLGPMHGPHRIPTLLEIADRLARGRFR
jgi:deoxyribonuclease V